MNKPQTLEEIRREKELTQSDVAEHLGISRQTYAKIERNPSRATIGQARVICTYLGFPYEDIFFGTNVSFINIEKQKSKSEASNDL